MQKEQQISNLSHITIAIRKLGVYRNYKGYNRLAYAIYLVLENESRLEAVIKEVYIPVAERFDCSWKAVERSLREIVNRIWITHYDELCSMANAKLTRPPTPVELLDIFAVYMTSHT